MYRFSTFLKCAQQIEAIALIQSRKSKIQLLQQTLNTYQKQEQIQFLQFMLAQIESPLNNIQIVIPEYSLFQALSTHFQIPYQTIKQMDGEIGDLSEVASQLTQNQKQSVQFDLIFDKLKSIYLTVGNGSQIIKEDQIKELLSLCSTQLEIKYLIRFLQKKMRIGLSTKGVSQVMDESLNQQILGYQRNSSNFGIPILPMLAKSYTQVPELIQDFVKKKQNTYYCEYKYDGERLQVHYQDGQVQLYGRSLESKTNKFPNLTLSLQEYLSSLAGLESAIFDCEMICYKEGHIIPFQDMQVKAVETSDQLSLVCFDILMKNSKTLIESPYSQRIKAYKSILPAITNERQLISHINSIKFNNQNQLQLLFDKAIIEGLEGLIVKRDVNYTPGLRSDWAKLKKDKDVDLALIGAYYGKGKRRQLYGSFLLGVYDEQNEAIQPITKIGTGFSDQDLKNFTSKYLPVQADGMVVSRPKPDVYFPIGTVWEVKYDIISISPTYQIKNDHFQGGLSLRFPRFIRERPDKAVTQCMTVDLLIEEYFKKVL